MEQEKNMLEQAALILEGGGMRGVYTAGVLDYFLEQALFFESCYGVSAGACHAGSYLSKQKGRAFAVNVDYLKDPRYCSIWSLLLTGNLFGAKMVYDRIPNEKNLFDYAAYASQKTKFYAVVTNCETGKAEYKQIKDMKEDIIYIRASSSLPLVSKIVKIDGGKYLDGGIADAIPIARAYQDGQKKVVAVLTRPAGYEKAPEKGYGALRLRYGKYKNFLAQIKRRHEVYNKSIAMAEMMQEAGSAFIIRPSKPIEVGRIEKNKEKLRELYTLGYEDAATQYDKMMDFLHQE